MNYPQANKMIPWFWLTGVFLSCSYIGYTIVKSPAIAYYLIIGIALGLSWLSACKPDLSCGFFTVWFSLLFLSGSSRAWVLFSIYTLIVSMFVPHYNAFLAWVVIIFWGGFFSLTAAVASAKAAKKLLNSFNKKHTFLILAGTSGIGLILPVILYRI